MRLAYGLKVESLSFNPRLPRGGGGGATPPKVFFPPFLNALLYPQMTSGHRPPILCAPSGEKKMAARNPRWPPEIVENGDRGGWWSPC